MGRTRAELQPLDDAARELVAGSLKIAHKAVGAYIARRKGFGTCTFPCSYDEMFSAGCMGLVHAASRYQAAGDDDRKRKWQVYARQCADGFISTEVQSRYLIAVPAGYYRKKVQDALALAKQDWYEVVPKKKTKGPKFDRHKWRAAELATRTQAYPCDLEVIDPRLELLDDDDD